MRLWIRRRLERIRKDLNCYITSRLEGNECIHPSATFEDGVSCAQPIAHKMYSSAIKAPTGRLLAPKPLRKATESPKLDQLLAEKEQSFSALLLQIIDEKGLKDSDVYKRANIDRRLFSKIRGDEDYVPSKKTAISFCLALKLSTNEANKLLATAGYTLSASSRFDLIIMYLIENGEYNIQFANIVLNDYGEGTLSR